MPPSGGIIQTIREADPSTFSLFTITFYFQKSTHNFSEE